MVLTSHDQLGNTGEKTGFWLEAGTGFTTLELKINFIRALTTTTGPVRALGKVIHSGRSTAIAEGRIEDPDGKLHALCTTTCLLFPMV